MEYVERFCKAVEPREEVRSRNAHLKQILERALAATRATRANEAWSLTSLLQRIVKTGGRLVKHVRYYWCGFAVSYLTRRLFGAILQQIWALPLAAG